MGVADMDRRCTPSPLSRSLWRSPTPNLCCSSMTASERRANLTSSWKRAWVPTATAVCPETRRSSFSRRTGPRSRPVSRTTPIPAASRGADRVSKCCRARISVGAIRAAWAPAAAASASASMATTVLPEPTSPCSRRLIRCPDERSARISARAVRWSGVRVKGRAASTPWARLEAGSRAPGPALRCARLWAMASWWARSSS